MFFLSFHVLIENERKSKKYINFSWQFNSIFSMFLFRFTTIKGKPSLLRKKIYDFTLKVTFFNNFLLISIFWVKQENKHYIHFLSLKLYKVSIFNLYGRLNTFCRKQLFHVTIYFFLCKIP